MAAFENFKNCSNLTDEQIEVIALVRRGMSAAVCGAIMSTVLVVFVILATLLKTRNRVYGTVVKRLSFGLIAICVIQQLNLTLQLVNYYHYDENYCKANGFFSQYFNTIELLFALGISLALFFKISPEVIPSWRSFKKAKKKAFTCHNTKLTKPEVATVVLMIVLPLLFDWIPFITNTYGQVATWCWIRKLNHNCTNTAGWWEKFWLWDVPFGLGFFLILILLVATLCLLGYRIKSAKVHNYKLIEVGIIEYLLLLAFMVFASCLVFLIFAFNFFI